MKKLLIVSAFSVFLLACGLALTGCDQSAGQEAKEKAAINNNEPEKGDNEDLTDNQPASKNAPKEGENENLTPEPLNQPAEEPEGGGENQVKEKEIPETGIETFSIYIDHQTGWNVYESLIENSGFRFKYPPNWKMERSHIAPNPFINTIVPERLAKDETDTALIKSADFKGENYITKEGILISIYNLGYVGNYSLETLRGDYGSSDMIEEKRIKIGGLEGGLLYTSEGNIPFAEEKYSDLICITSKVAININGNAFIISFATGGDKRRENYQFFKTLLDKIELIEN